MIFKKHFFLIAAFGLLISSHCYSQEYERRDISFISDGDKCAGWFYVSNNLKQGEKRPVIVMAHGFSAIKEMGLDRYAKKFVNAGFNVLVFDYRYFGASEGEPRGQLFYYQQIEDYQNAITWASIQREVAADQIGIWGTSFSGGHVLYIAAVDKRVKALVSQVPFTDSETSIEPLKRHAELFAESRKEEYLNGTVNYIPIVDSLGKFAFFLDSTTYQVFSNAPPPWKNQITIESYEKTSRYLIKPYVPLISPTPLLMLIVDSDNIIPTQDQIETFNLAKEPKELIIAEGGHFDAYRGEIFESFSNEAVKWFEKYLGNEK